MLRTVDLTGFTSGYRSHLPRAEFDVEAATAVVRPVCEDVRVRGVEALADYSQRFDGVVPEHFRVPAEALEAAADELDPELAAAFAARVARLERDLRQVGCARRVEGRDRALDVEVAATQREIRASPTWERWASVARGAPLDRRRSSITCAVVRAQTPGVGSVPRGMPPA